MGHGRLAGSSGCYGPAAQACFSRGFDEDGILDAYLLGVRVKAGKSLLRMSIKGGKSDESENYPWPSLMAFV